MENDRPHCGGCGAFLKVRSFLNEGSSEEESYECRNPLCPERGGKPRRNALHRAGEDMARELEEYGFTLDADARILTTPMGTYEFRKRMTRTDCRAAIRRYTRMVDTSRKLTHDILAEKMQDPLL